MNTIRPPAGIATARSRSACALMETILPVECPYRPLNGGDVSGSSATARIRPQSYSAPLTSAVAHILVMIVRSTKRKTIAAPATTSARRTPTVAPRTVAAAIANATSAGAGRGPLIAEPLSMLLP